MNYLGWVFFIWPEEMVWEASFEFSQSSMKENFLFRSAWMFPLNRFFIPGAFIIMQSTQTPNFKYTTSFNKTTEIIHIHCISTEMLCRAMMSPHKVSTNQVLWSEPTYFTLGESSIEATVCFSVITDRIPELSHPKNKGYFCSLALSLLGSGADVPSAFLHADRLHSPLTSSAQAAAPLPALPWWGARRLLHLLHCIMIFSIQFCAGETRFVTGPVCSLGLYKPPGMYTGKMYIIKHPEQSWPRQASPRYHKHLNENCVRWEKHRYVLDIFGQNSSCEALFFYQTRLAGFELAGKFATASSHRKEKLFPLAGPYQTHTSIVRALNTFSAWDPLGNTSDSPFP